MNLITYSTKVELEQQFCQEIEKKLKEAIHQSGVAKMLVSGGSTPKNLFQKLSHANLPWEKVTIGLADDRFVDPENESSNERFLNENLLINKAAKATLLCLVYTPDAKKENLITANKTYHFFHSGIDLTILGMGKDGHTASLFPTDPDSLKGLASNFHDLVLYTKADVEPYQRISCSRSLLHKSRNLYLMITGEEKLNVLNSAKENNLPISAFFETHITQLNVHYTAN